MNRRFKGEYKVGAKALIVGASTPFGRTQIGKTVTLAVCNLGGVVSYEGHLFVNVNIEPSWIVTGAIKSKSESGKSGVAQYRQSHLMPLDATDFDKDMFTIEKRIKDKV